MHSFIVRFLGSVLAALAFSNIACASPVTYNFTASNFTASLGSELPASIVTGSVTLNGTLLEGISLTLGSHTYSLGEVGTLPPPTGTSILIGGLLNDVNRVVFGTDDFSFSFNRTNLAGPKTFGYSVFGVNDAFRAGTIEITRANDVPEPGTLALSGLAALGLLSLRKRSQI